VKRTEFLRLLNAAVDRPREGVVRFSTVCLVTGSTDPALSPNLIIPLRPDRETVIDLPRMGFRIVRDGDHA
jgi:hypothetical protein